MTKIKDAQISVTAGGDGVWIWLHSKNGKSFGFNVESALVEEAGFRHDAIREWQNDMQEQGMRESSKPEIETSFAHPKTGEITPYGRPPLCTNVACVLEEVRRARGMFPARRHILAALVEEVGELSQAMIDHDRGKGSTGDIFNEAKQVAAMAFRIMEEGDEAFSYPLLIAPNVENREKAPGDSSRSV